MTKKTRKQRFINLQNFRTSLDIQYSKVIEVLLIRFEEICDSLSKKDDREDC